MRQTRKKARKQATSPDSAHNVASASPSADCQTCGLLPYHASSLFNRSGIDNHEFTCLVRSSHSPTDLQATQIREYILRVGEDRKQVQDQIKHLLNHVKDLEAKEAQLSHIHQQCDSVLAHIRTLPLEILHIIFEYSCSEEIYNEVSIERRREPWNISNVCSS